MQLPPITFLILIFGFFTQRSFSLYDLNQRTFKNNQLFYHTTKKSKQSLLDSEVMNIDSELVSSSPLIIDFTTPHGLIIFKDCNNITIDVDYLTNDDSIGDKHHKITNNLITKDTAAFFFGNSIGQIAVHTNLPNNRFSAVKIMFPEACQQFYLQTKYDNYQVNENAGKTELISSFSLTEESSLTCYFLDMDFVPYFVSFKFNDDDDFVKINGKITNSKSSQIIFTEKSILTFEDVYFSKKALDISRQQAHSISKPYINMTILTHISNYDDSVISNIMKEIVYFKGYIQNTPGFIKGYLSGSNTTDEIPNNTVNKKNQTTPIIATVLCIIVLLILCSAISYCIKKRKYCSFNNIEDNNDEIIPRDREIIENDASSSIGHEVGADVDRSNDEFEDSRKYLQNEFDERYPQNNFQHSNIEYKVPSQSLLATVLDEENAKL